LASTNAQRRDPSNSTPSPEYTIVSALDDSCVLFAVKETAANMISSASPRDDEDNMLQQSPVQMPRNFYDGFSYTTDNHGSSSEESGSREAGLSMLDNPELR
jgi:hypothetical protein